MKRKADARGRFPVPAFIKALRYAAAPAVIATALLAGAGCAGPGKESLSFFPEEGISIPKAEALAWLSGERFVSVTADGICWEWDIFSGLVAVSRGGFPETYRAFPVNSPGGGSRLSPAEDGAIILADSGTGKELARYYGFAREDGPPEWLSVLPNGIFNASFGGGTFLAAESGAPASRAYRRYSLEQLSGALYRPDLFEASLQNTGIGGKRPEPPETLAGLFRDENLPPELSLSLDDAEKPGTISVKISAGKGGVGQVAVYSIVNGVEIPARYLDAESAAIRKYVEKGKNCYELNISSGEVAIAPHGELSVSAFNKGNTIESKRYRVMLPQVPGMPAAEKAIADDASPRILRALLTAGDNVENLNAKNGHAEGKPENSGGVSPRQALGEALALQSEGTLFESAEMEILSGDELSRERFLQSLGRMAGMGREGDVLVLGLGARAGADSGGQLRIMTGNSETGNEISGDDILELALGRSRASLLFVLDLEGAEPEPKIKTALLRFRKKLGPKAMLAAYHPSGNGFRLFSSVADLLNGEHSTGASAGASFSVFLEDRFLSASDLVDGVARGEKFLAFAPRDDFKVADLYINSGELKFQTMSSGLLKIDRVDKEPIPLAFGSTMVRILPPGSYIIDMIYRNGYRETKTAELKRKGSIWVIFNYTPALLNGDLSRLPSLGINLSELNPVNYEKVNREAMEGMGMAPYYVAFLAGEKLYKDGDYGKAISEYSRSISLKSDYADAYASRGNARRRSGDTSRAIEDYTRAIGLNKTYAEVYNYRGFVYAQRGELNRAIDDYSQAIKNRSGYTDAYFNRAYAYAKQGSWDLAIADYTQVIRAEPSNGAAYRERGNAHQKKGDTAKAEADFSAAEKFSSR